MPLYTHTLSLITKRCLGKYALASGGDIYVPNGNLAVSVYAIEKRFHAITNSHYNRFSL
jgi:hypothetical protein